MTEPEETSGGRAECEERVSFCDGCVLRQALGRQAAAGDFDQQQEAGEDKCGRGGGISAVGGGKGRRCGTRVATNVRQGSARVQCRGLGSSEPRGSAENVLARWAAAIIGEELGEIRIRKVHDSVIVWSSRRRTKPPQADGHVA